MKIFFVRHGESHANLLHEISNRGLKHPLTSTGRQQAAALAAVLQEQNIIRIYTSPVLRAIETAVLLADRLGVDYEVVEALREYDVGILEGRSDQQAWNEWRAHFEAWATHQRLEQHVEGGESFFDVRQRFVPFINQLVQEYGNSQANLGCVSHGGIYWMMLPQILGNVDLAFIQGQGGIDYTTCITAELALGGLVCTGWHGKPMDAPHS